MILVSQKSKFYSKTVGGAIKLYLSRLEQEI